MNKPIADLTQEEITALRALTEQGPLLLDMAMRAQERRSRTGKATGEVKSNNWTIEEARLRGLQNSLKSALQAHQNSMKVLEAAQIEADRTAGDVQSVKNALDAFMVEHDISL